MPRNREHVPRQERETDLLATATELFQRHGYVTITRDDWFIYQVSGPNALKVLSKLTDGEALLDTKFMWVAPIRIAGHDIYALRQGMAGEIGFELQGPKAIGQEIYDAVLGAGREFGIRRMGGRVAMINHLETSYPTIATDYIPAIFDESMADYLDVFRSSMPDFAQPAYIAGSYEGKEIGEYYRSPIELGWGRTVNVHHDFIGRDALAEEKENPPRLLRTLVWNAEDVQKAYASLFSNGQNHTYMDMPATSAASCGRTVSSGTASSSASPPRAATATTSARCSRWRPSTSRTPTTAPRSRDCPDFG